MIKNCDKLHLSCKCARDFIIPPVELLFIKGQREKLGTTGKYRIACTDRKYEEKKIRNLVETKQKEFITPLPK